MDEKIKEMQELAERLNRASEAYYNGLPEVMTDYEWDAGFDRLSALEKETGIVLENSPTQNVSADDTAGTKEEHEFAALSLAKTKRIEDLVKWAEMRPIWLSWKLDGLTLVATYDSGRLTKLVTRGDGHIGTNITHLAKSLFGVPGTITEPGHLVIRGEAVISYEDFDTFVAESGEDYANPRNLASGSLSLKDPEEVRRRKIHWIPFTLVYCEDDIPSWGERMEKLRALGFDCVESVRLDYPDTETIQNAVDAFTKKVTDGINPYPVDGLVVTYDDTVYAASGSVTGHHATRAGYAFKWQDTAAASILDHIEWSCAASTITPVAVFAPVQLEGTTVKRASLCNISECERLGIGGAGTAIEVIKANKIIPKVIRVQKSEGTLQIPDSCPVCGQPTVINTSDVSGTKTLRCTNPACAAKQLRKYARFVSKPGMDIDGISTATLARFISEGWIHEYRDIFRLGEHEEEIRELDRFGERSARNIIASVESSRTVPDVRLLYALNIPLVAQDVAKRLLSAYPLDELVTKAEQADREDIFAEIDGIGPEKSSAFVRWFRDADNRLAFDRLMQEIQVTSGVQAASGARCAGMVFVVTGDVHHYKNRNELKAYIESQGGKVTGSVSKATNFLINNDIQSTSSKNKKAQSLGIPILSEEDFLARFGE